MRTAAVLTLLLILAASPVLASKGSDGEGTLAFAPVPDARASVELVEWDSERAVDSWRVQPVPTHVVRSTVRLPANPPRVVDAEPLPASSPIAGVASWYCGP